MARAVDEFPVPFVSSQRQPGGLSVRVSGTGLTTARTLRGMGADVSLATYVGADALGTLAAHWLREYELYGPATLRCESQPRAMVLYDRTGARAGATDLRTTPGLHYPVEVFESLVDGYRKCDMVVLGNIGFTRALIPVAVDRGIPIATDVHAVDDIDGPHNQPWLRAATVLACSHERLPVEPSEWVRMLWQRYGTEIVLIGRGSAGAILGDRRLRSIWHIRAVAPRGVCYTSGAGDTLLAAFVGHYLDSGDAVSAARHAVLAAGWKVGGHPDDAGVLSADQLVGLRATNGLPIVTRIQ